ncbi:glycosyltransferase family 2 protein [Shimia biformata]|uniref:glycosyltransferase family 2 protein n=1 Tax=Shimia biformata TaxID=1294299 RepID=UPI00194F8DDE|nr:glycosyltransferase [Shimia biformata]
MTALPVSVVVVSRGRPANLLRALTGIAQQIYPVFEIVVVADPGGVDALRAGPFADTVKIVSFDEPNISAARNLGVTVSAGEVVAFIDDDAVPEPTWLTHLVQPFEQPEVVSSGGYVLGRNGISFQWRARSVDSTGVASDLAVPGDAPVVLTPPKGKAIKTEGTNMAFRRDVLAAIGGFDPAFRFFLDETDLNMRLALDGKSTAIVPRALVHHGYVESPRRTRNRAPSDLFEIGASQTLFLRKFCPTDRHAEVLEAFRAEQRHRLLRAMVAGLLEPRDVRRVMASLKAGIAEGKVRKLNSLPPLSRCAEGFRAFPRPAKVQSHLFAGRLTSHRARMEKARFAVQQGHISTVVTLSPTSLFHQVRFTDDGVWVQRGGVFGKSRRDQPLFRLTRFDQRLKEEACRVADVRLLRET